MKPASRWHVHRIPTVGWRVDEVPADCAASGFSTLEEAEAAVRGKQEAELHEAEHSLEMARKRAKRKRDALANAVSVRRRKQP